MDKYTELEKQAQKFLDETDTMQFSTVELLTMFYNHQEQLRIPVVVGQSEQLLGFGRYLQKWSNTFLSEEHLKQEIENYLKDK